MKKRETYTHSVSDQTRRMHMRDMRKAALAGCFFIAVTLAAILFLRVNDPRPVNHEKARSWTAIQYSMIVS